MSFLSMYGIYPVEGIGVFCVPKNGDAWNPTPPALRVETMTGAEKFIDYLAGQPEKEHLREIVADAMI